MAKAINLHFLKERCDDLAGSIRTVIKKDFKAAHVKIGKMPRL
jgi:hypothetical protein